MSKTLRALQERISKKMPKAIALANKNTVRNNQGHIVLPKDEKWRKEDYWEK